MKINKVTLKQKWMAYKRSPFSLFLLFLVTSATLITVLVIATLIGYTLYRGLPEMKWSLFEWSYHSENVSLMPALINTILMTMLALLIAAPVGIFSAIYSVEYAKRGNRLVALVRITAETLAGIPSIVYGLFGLLFFVTYLQWGLSLLSGAFTLGIMILPLIMRTTEEALISVADIYREGSFGLGAGRLRTVFKIVLPSAIPGIMAGIVLSVGRIVGETVALIYTAGTIAQIPDLMSSGRTLSVHMYALWSEGFHVGEAYATAVILLLIVVGLNAFSTLIARVLSKG